MLNQIFELASKQSVALKLLFQLAHSRMKQLTLTVTYLKEVILMHNTAVG